MVVLLHYSLEAALMMTRVPGTTVIMANCGHRGFAAPETLEFIANDPRGQAAYIMCDICSNTVTLADIAKHPAAVVPGSMDRLRKTMPTHEMDQLGAFLRENKIEEL